MSETPRSAMLRRWMPLLALGLLLGALLLLGERLDRFPQASSAPSGSIWLRGARRRVVESLNSPSTLGGAGAPTFSPAPGSYEKSLRVELLPADRRATVIFTTDGTLPTAEVGALYREPLLLDVRQPGVTVIRAVQVLDGGDGQRVVGPVATAVYVVGLNSQLPVLSLTLDPAALWSAESGILANPSFRGDDWERPVDVAWFEPEGAPLGEASFALPAGLRVHGDVPLSAPKQSLRLYFRAEYGAARLEYPLFPGHPDQPEVEQSYKRLLLQAGDRNGWWTLFRDQLVAETAATLGLPVAQGRFVHLFINGRSWGLYRLSERVDRFFLEDNFGYQSVDVVQEGRSQEGDDAAWDALVDWAAANDLEDPQAFAYVVSRLDIANFADFAVLKLFFDFSPEDLFAVRNRGGAWHFVYGGGGQHFAQRPDELPLLLGLTDDSDFTVLFRALMDNAEFRSALVARTSDLLNTLLAPKALAARAGDLSASLVSAIPYEEARWSAPSQGAPSQGAQAVWAEHVTALQAFLAARPDALRALLVERLGRGAPAQVQITVEPPAGGEVFVGGLPLPGAGVFFTGAELHFVAVPHAGYTFAGWEGAPEAATGTSPVLNMQVTGPQSLTARFRQISEDEPGPYPDDVIINEFWINDNGTRYASLDGRPITGDWVELLVRRPASVDLRGWRLTDNDTKTGNAEGSLIFPQLDALAAVPRGTVILIIVTENSVNAANFPADDLDWSDGRMIFYVGSQPGSGNLDATTDPGFALGTNDDNLVLLAPALGAAAPGAAAPSGALGVEIGIDFVAEGAAVTPYSFGVLADGVRFETPFRYLGGDDGAVFQALTSNDSGSAWLLDPAACESGDAFCLDAANQLTPGALNPGQRPFPWIVFALLILIASLLLGALLLLEARRRARR
ncbi:MAG: CotH kinase family protein [Anaerolineae bacterium]|nr:CotH kinase family protein [Anaerolineae bacterium]